MADPANSRQYRDDIVNIDACFKQYAVGRGTQFAHGFRFFYNTKRVAYPNGIAGLL